MSDQSNGGGGCVLANTTSSGTMFVGDPPTPRTFNQVIHSNCEDAAKMIIKKQRDYGKNNILIFGEIGVMVRMSDKFERLKNLLSSSKSQISPEKLKDLSDRLEQAVCDNNTQRIAEIINKLDAMGTIQEPQNESIDDTIDDIIGYANLWKMLRQGTFELPLV